MRPSTSSGWADALAEDHPTAVAVLFETQGETNATSSALDQVLSAALGVPDLAPAVVVLPPLGAVEPPGRLEGARLVVRGLGTEAVARRDDAMVVAKGNGGDELFVVPVSALRAEPISGLDPALGLVVVSGEIDHASPIPAVDWSAAVAAGQLALGYELVGTGRTMLELARQHALERIQFGQPIASFQAVRHRLAESLVALEAAAALLAAASDEPSPVHRGHGQGLRREVRAHRRPPLPAGPGRHRLHHRARPPPFRPPDLPLDQLLGAGSVLTRQLGAEVLAARSLPASFPL